MTTGKVVVGVCGGIAAFKSAALVSKLVQRGFDVWVVLTSNATQFVGPATFTALCGRPPVVHSFDPAYPLGPHIELAVEANVLIIAPATARAIASCSLGLANDLLSTLYLQVECPVLMAPAMSQAMWQKPAVQRHIEQLATDGVQMVGPESGWLSCRQQGTGRMADPDLILNRAVALLK